MIDELVFLPDEDVVVTAPPEHWNILIVDDEMDVHTMTRFSLRDIEINGRKLNLLDAYSGKEAIEFLKKSPDIDLILLDMVMESHDAGLKVAHWLREEAGRIDTPIVVLRTGHPGSLSAKDIASNKHFNGMIEKQKTTFQSLVGTLSQLLPHN